MDEERKTVRSYFNLTWRVSALKNNLNGVAMSLSPCDYEEYTGPIYVIYRRFNKNKISLVKATYKAKAFFSDFNELFNVFGRNTPEMLKDYYKFGELDVKNYLVTRRIFQYCASIIGKISAEDIEIPVVLVASPYFSDNIVGFSETLLFSSLIKGADDNFAKYAMLSLICCYKDQIEKNEDTLLNVLAGIEPTDYGQILYDRTLTQGIISRLYNTWIEDEDSTSVEEIFPPTFRRDILNKRRAVRKVWMKQRGFNLLEGLKLTGI